MYLHPHCPRDQNPCQQWSYFAGAPGVHHKRRPQDMTKITRKITKLLDMTRTTCDILWTHNLTVHNHKPKVQETTRQMGKHAGQCLFLVNSSTCYQYLIEINLSLCPDPVPFYRIHLESWYQLFWMIFGWQTAKGLNSENVWVTSCS